MVVVIVNGQVNVDVVTCDTIEGVKAIKSFVTTMQKKSSHHVERC